MCLENIIICLLFILVVVKILIIWGVILYILILGVVFISKSLFLINILIFYFFKVIVVFKV